MFPLVTDSWNGDNKSVSWENRINEADWVDQRLDYRWTAGIAVVRNLLVGCSAC